MTFSPLLKSPHICPGFHQNSCHAKMPPDTSQEKRRTAILVQSSHHMSIAPQEPTNRCIIPCSQAGQIALQNPSQIVPRPRPRSIDEAKYIFDQIEWKLVEILFHTAETIQRLFRNAENKMPGTD